MAAAGTWREGKVVCATSSPSFRTRLRSGDVLYGLVVKMPACATIEMGAQAGFDFVVLDGEHGGAETDGLEHHLRAADSRGMAALVRVGDHTPLGILRALDAGAAGVVVPHVCGPDDAAAIVRAAHYPPVGSRGLATSTRAGGHGFVPLADHLRDAAANTAVVLQIEDRAALPHVADIAGMACVDALLVGSTDLSMSLGYPGELDHPDVATAIDGIAATVADVGGAALGAYARNERDAAAWKARGARFIMFSSTALFAQKLVQVADGLRR